jgi:hypothetical protein
VAPLSATCIGSAWALQGLWAAPWLNACLNMLHIGGAFVVQAAIGGMVHAWQPDEAGQYPLQAYQTAFLTIVILQTIALAWLCVGYETRAVKRASATPAPTHSQPDA